MTRNRILLGLCGLFGLATCAIVSPASARSADGYSTFRPLPDYAHQTCVTETFGGALNNCGSTIGPTIFELQTDNAGTNTITAVSFGPGSGAIGNCYAVSLNPANSTTFNRGNIQTFNVSGEQTLSFSVNVNPGWSLRLQCDNIPNQRGIGGMNW